MTRRYLPRTPTFQCRFHLDLKHPKSQFYKDYSIDSLSSQSCQNMSCISRHELEPRGRTLAFRFHESDLFYLALEDEKPVVVQINSLGSEELGNFLELATSAIDLIVRRVIFGGCPGHDELRFGDNSEPVLFTVIINDFLKVHLNFARLHIGMVLRVVNQDRNLLRPDLLGSVAKDEKHGIDDV